MSVVWIKTDKENNIHSIYCDGRVIDDSNQIHNEDNCKIKQFSIGNNSILIGTVGSTYSCDYLTNHIYEVNYEKINKNFDFASNYFLIFCWNLLVSTKIKQ